MDHAARPGLIQTLRYWISPLAILLVWWGWTVLGHVDPHKFPSPVEVVTSAVELAERGLLWESLLASLARILVGVFIGLALGVPIGLISGASKLSEVVVDRPIQMLRAIPFNALTPVLIIGLGIGEVMKVSLIVIGVFVPIYLNTRDGVRALDPKLLELARVYRIPPRVVFPKILLAGVMPSILTGLRFSLAIAWIALVTAETINVEQGVGYILKQAQQFVRMDQMVLCIVLYALLGLLTDWVVRLLESYLLRWRVGAVTLENPDLPSDDGAVPLETEERIPSWTS
jgi:sulfonate transport system permease protein